MTTPGPTTINDIADLYRILEERPQWKEALRHQLLGPELLAIPQRLDQLLAGIHELRQTVSQLGQTVSQLVETAVEHTRQLVELREIAVEHTRQLAELRETAAEHTRQLAELRETAAEHTRQLADLREIAAEHTRQLADLREIAAEHTRQLTAHTARMNRMESDMSELKGMQADYRPERTCSIIADELQLADPDPLLNAELIRFANRLDLDQATRRSFIRADLVFLAQDQDNAPRYSAVEISWTVGQRDIDRARRNAALIQQATGIPTLAVAAGHRYEERLDWTEVTWVQLTAS